MVLFLATGDEAGAATNVSGFMASSTTWTLEQSPYVVEGSGGGNFVVVESGATLTIESGVVVKFASSGQLIVRGELDAQGNEENPITFTSLTDDSVAGDTNGDGASSSPGPGAWWHVVFESGSIGTTTHSIIRYAGGTAPFCPPSCSGAGIYNNGGALAISHSLITKNKSYGIRQDEGSLSLTDSEVSDHIGVPFSSESGVVISGGLAELRRNTIHDNARYGVAALGGELRLHDNSFFNNASAAGVIHAPVDFIHSGNAASGSGKRGFVVGGIVTGEKTWNKDLPYIIASQASLVVDHGATLSLDPGVIIKSEGLSGLVVRGTLDVKGIEEQRVIFTSLADDQAGGDTNADGSSSVPGPGTWFDITFEEGSTGTLSYADVRYAGAVFSFCDSCSGSGIINKGGNVSLDHALITDNNIYGLRQSKGTLTVADSEISKNGDYGVSMDAGSASLSLTSVSHHKQYGLRAGSGSLTITDNLFSDNLSGAIEMHASVNLIQSNNTASGAGRRGIVTAGVLGTNKTWTPGLPYIIPSGGSVIVDAGSTLTLKPGTIIKSEHMAELVIQGTLEAKGIQTDKIYFTSIHDDTVGGDTNADGANFGHPGEWLHLRFVAGSRGVLEHAVMRYAGSFVSFCGDSCSLSGIVNQGGDVDISYSTVSDNLSYGIRHQGGTTNIHQSAIYNNTGYSIWNETSNPVGAQNNWWGHASGPFHFPTNISGEGNPVTDYVDFEPWLGSDPTITPPTGISTLAYAKEPGFEEDEENPGIDPNIGTHDSTPFYFKTVYTNANNNPPSQMSVVINDVSKAMIVDSYAEPELRDGNYENGEQYVFTDQFSAGSYHYHFEAIIGSDTIRLPAQGELTFTSGLFVTPKGSINIRSGRGISHSVLGAAGKNALIELFPLCSAVPPGQNCNDENHLYEKIDGHYWLHASTTGITGYVADDFVISIVQKNQAERIKTLMREVMRDPDFETLENFPLEVYLALISIESGRTFNNEVTSGDSPFGGIKQVHPSTSGGWNANCKLREVGGRICLRAPDQLNWKDLDVSIPMSDLFLLPLSNHDDTVFMDKNYINTRYNNSDEGLSLNINHGLQVLKNKFTDPIYGVVQTCAESREIKVVKDVLDGDVPFTCSQREIAKTLWLYNGMPPGVMTTTYLPAIADALAVSELQKYFPGPFDDQSDLAYKLRIAARNKIEVKKFSPIHLRVYDADENVIGEFADGIKNTMEDAVYDRESESIALFFPGDGMYRYEVEGKENDAYGLLINFYGPTATTTFVASDIPTAPGAIHEYAIDEEALGRGENGVTVKIDKEGDGVFEEEIRTGATFTDETPPEAIISLDPDTLDLVIAGKDAISPTVSVSQQGLVYTLTDESGNTTEITFDKWKDKKNGLKASIGNLSYNGISTGQLPENKIYYHWGLDKSGTLKHLTQKIVIKKEERIMAEYNAKKDETKVFVKDFNSKMKYKETLPGLVLLNLATNQGNLDISY